MLATNGSTFTKTTSLFKRPCDCAVETVTVFLKIFPTSVLYVVLKLWYSPDPIFVKYNSPYVLVTLVNHTKFPSVPSPTLKVEIPIRLSAILAT